MLHCEIIGSPVNYARHFGINVVRDDCDVDNTGDWSPLLNGSLSFSADRYLFSTSGDAGTMRLTSLNIIANHIYQVTLDIINGSVSKSDVLITFYDGSVQNMSLPATTASFVRVSVIFVAQSTATGYAGIRTVNDWGGENIGFKNFTVDDITDMVLPGTPLLVHDTTGDSLLPADWVKLAGGNTLQDKYGAKLSRQISAVSDVKSAYLYESGTLTKLTLNNGDGYAFDNNWAGSDSGIKYWAIDSVNNYIFYVQRNDTLLDDNAVILVFYKTKAKFLESASNSVQIARGDVTITNDYQNGVLPHLLGKVPVNNTEPTTKKVLMSEYRMRPDIDALHDGSLSPPKHDSVEIGGAGPAVKYWVWLSREDGIGYVDILFKEMIKDDVDGWGDNLEFKVAGGINIMADENSNNALYGMKRFEADIFIPEKD